MLFTQWMRLNVHSMFIAREHFEEGSKAESDTNSQQ